MYNKFCVTNVETSAIDKTIVIDFNYDLDEDTITATQVNLSSLSGTAEPFKLEVSNKRAILKLKKWPNAGVEYILTVDAAVANISGTTLEANFRKKIKFVSEISSQVTIKSPYNFEQIDNLHFEVSDTEDIGSYYVEIAKENRFYNLVYDSDVFVNTFDPVIPKLSPGQYYVRFRCQEGENYGPWSKTITFIYKYICDDDVPEEDGPSANAEMPSAWSDLYKSDSVIKENGDVISTPTIEQMPTVEIEDILEVITKPESGETPNAFVFEFDKDLDICFGEVVIIKREF